MSQVGHQLAPPRATFAELFTPKLVTVLQEGYGLKYLKDDAIAGLTVAIVALPLSMAIAIGSGVGPERGLYTAIVGGFLISLLGGSRFQIGGPAGAFIALLAVVIERHGYDGLALATIMAGAMMIAVGLLRLGTYVKYIPYPVVVGFTAGIAVIIIASQLREMLGLSVAHEPAQLLPKLQVLIPALSTTSVVTVLVTLGSMAVILLVRHFRPNWPSLLIAVVLAALATAILSLDVATIGSRFGELPRTLPAPGLPPFSLAKLQAVFPDAVAIALLGAIESLLSAVVADGMTGRRHRSNCELVAQGVGNIGSALFGGIPVTGTIARTATNVRSGARGPVSGMLHAIYLALFMLVAAPLVKFIPLAALGAVLAVVAWNMAERAEFRALLTASWGDALVLLATFLLTILHDLVTGIGVGVVLGSFLILHRLAESVVIEGGPHFIEEDRPDREAPRPEYDASRAADPEMMVYRISGAFFFGAAAGVSGALERGGKYPRVLVLDFSGVPLIDSTGVHVLKGFVQKMRKLGTNVVFAAARPDVRRGLLAGGLRKPLVRFVRRPEDARRRLSPQPTTP